jgi:hypothetical protein
VTHIIVPLGSGAAKGRVHFFLTDSPMEFRGYSVRVQDEQREKAVRQVIVLSPEKASDFDGEMPALGDALKAELPDVDIEIRDPLKSPPGAFFPPEVVHVLTVIVPYAAGYSFDKAADLIAAKLRGAFKRGADEKPTRIVKMYGPDGKLLKRIEIADEDLDSEDA